MEEKTVKSGSSVNNDAMPTDTGVRQSWRIEMGARIQAASKLIGSQQKAADAAGVSLSTLQRYFKGEVDPSLEGVKRLADESGVLVGWLITGEGPQRLEDQEKEEDDEPEVIRMATHPPHHPRGGRAQWPMDEAPVVIGLRILDEIDKAKMTLPSGATRDLIKLALMLPNPQDCQQLISRIIRNTDG